MARHHPKRESCYVQNKINAHIINFGWNESVRKRLMYIQKEASMPEASSLVNCNSWVVKILHNPGPNRIFWLIRGSFNN